MSSLATTDVDAAFARYEAVRHRFPQARFPRETVACSGLRAIADRFDAFLLDGFGVLNVGDTPIPGAIDCLAALAAMGKRLIVLTNAASYTSAAAAARYRRLGFDLSDDQIVSSRDACLSRLPALSSGGCWGAICAPEDRLADLPDGAFRWTGRDSGDAAGFVFLSSAALDDALPGELEAALAERPRPFVIANPDLVAPREGGLSREPGLYAHAIADRLGLAPEFYGKPFGNAFDDAMARLGDVDPARVAMVGDTLHTDILGGRAAGLGTVLVCDHGLLAGREASAYIAASGIVPDFMCPAI